MKKKLLNFTLSFMLSLIPTVQVLAATPGFNSFSRPLNAGGSGIYYLQGTPLPISVSTYNYPYRASVYWNYKYTGIGQGVNLNTSDGVNFSGNWTPTTYFKSDGTIDKTDFIPGTISSPTNPVYNLPANFSVDLENSSGGCTSSKSGYVTAGTSFDWYKSMDESFFYNDESWNSFFGPGTNAGHNEQINTYNCLAYAVDIYTMWQWPFSWIDYDNDPQDIPLSLMLDYMNGKDDGLNDNKARTCGTLYNHGTRMWTPFTTKVIYYDNGHFAKVVTYNSDGSPNIIRSKWGRCELIQSISYDPFSYDPYTKRGYGRPLYYFY